MIEPTELLEKYDYNDYRIIWCCYKYKSFDDDKIRHERIRLHEEINFSRLVMQNDDNKKVMYK